MSLQQFYYKRNRLQQLRGFYFVMQRNSISAAAKALHLNQSTVTLQIQSLERDLGVKLFRRHKRLVEPTEDGQLLYEMIVPYIQGVDGVHEQFLEAKNNKAIHKIEIAAHHVAISYLLPSFIRKFSEQYPNTILSLHNISRDVAFERLKQGKIDVAIYPNIPCPLECESKPIFSYEPALIMHHTHPLAKRSNISLSELANYNFIRIDPSLITLPLFEEAYKTYQWKSNISFEGGDWEMLKHFVRENLGIALVSMLCVEKKDKLIVARSMQQYFPKMEYRFFLKKGQRLSKPACAFIELIENEVKALK